VKLLSLNAADLQDLYGGRQAALFAARTTGLKRPFRGAVAILAVDGCSTMHAHLEGEIFVIMEGRARVETDQGSALLEGGDAAELGSLERHRVYNIDPVRRLLYLKLWWPGELNLPAADQSEPQPQLTIVTATPPTPNGDLHLGHISGPYLRADIFTRYLRMKGRPAIYLTGLDDHQSYVATKAASRGEKPDDTASLYGQMIEASWKASNIALDFIGKPRESKRHASCGRGCDGPEKTWVYRGANGSGLVLPPMQAFPLRSARGRPVSTLRVAGERQCVRGLLPSQRLPRSPGAALPSLWRQSGPG